MNNLWLICSSCGFNASIPQDQLKEWRHCPNCQGHLVLDVSQGKRLDSEEDFKIHHIGKEKAETIHYNPKEKLIEIKEPEELQEIKEFTTSDLKRISKHDIIDFALDLNLFYWEELLKGEI